jgi:hypothetical protein
VGDIGKVVIVKPRRKARRGVIKGETGDKECWIVLFEGKTALVEVHKSVCEVQREGPST